MSLAGMTSLTDQKSKAWKWPMWPWRVFRRKWIILLESTPGIGWVKWRKEDMESKESSRQSVYGWKNLVSNRVCAVYTKLIRIDHLTITRSWERVFNNFKDCFLKLQSKIVRLDLLIASLAWCGDMFINLYKNSFTRHVYSKIPLSKVNFDFLILFH